MDAETVVLNLSGNVAAQAAIMNSALAQLQAQAAAVATRLKEPLKSSTYRDIAAQIKAIDPSAAVPGFDALAQADASIADSANAATDALQSQTSATKAAGDSAGAAADGAKKMATATENSGDAATDASLNLGALGKVAHSLPGPLGSAAQHAVRLGSAFSRLGPATAIAAATIVAFVAVLYGAISLFAKGIEAAGALRDEFLRLQGAAKGSASAAAATQAAIAAVSSASALSRDKIEGYAVALEKAGLEGDQLKRALEAMAIAGSAGGEEAAQAFLKSAAAAKGTAGAVDALAAKTKKELGGVAAAQALSLSAQFEKLKENIAAIFSGANIEPFLRAMRDILSLFSQTSASGKAMKSVITSFVNYAIGAFIKTATAILKMYIALKQSTVGWFLVKAVAYGVLAVIALLAAAGLLAVVSIVAMAAFIALPFIIAGAAIYAVYAAGKALYDKLRGISWASIGNAITSPFKTAFAWLRSLSLGDIGSAIIRGLVAGIMAAGGAVLSALTGIVSGAVGAVKNLLGIHSPSRVFMALGAQTGEGMAKGVDDSAGDVQSSAKAMVAPPSIKAGASTNSGHTLTFNNCIFGGDTTKEKIKEWLVDILDGERLAAEPAR